MKPAAVLATIDGLRAEALEQTHCPNLDRLRRTGAYTWRASSVMPSITLPCFLSIFHSVPPQYHGTLHNTWMPMTRPVPGLVDVARQAEKKCAFFHNWEPLRNLNVPLSLSFSYFIDNLNDGPDSDFVIVEQAIDHIRKGWWDFVFVYLGSLDVMGHQQGWMSQAYLKQLEHLDAAVGLLLDALPAETNLLLTSDHGGHARTHGTDSPEDMVVPWFMQGPNIRAGYEISASPNLLDVAPTIARFLGISPHPAWEGHCISEAFQDGISSQA